LSQNLDLLDWRPVPVKVGLKLKITPILGAPPRRTLYSNRKKFLNRTRRLAASVEGLNSSLDTAAVAL